MQNFAWFLSRWFHRSAYSPGRVFLLSLLFLGSMLSTYAQFRMHWEQDFEAGFPGGWAVDAGTWEVGPPTSGPGSGYSGANVAGTSLAGNYAEWVHSRLITHSFLVPAATEQPVLRFWQWYSFGEGDYGQIQIKVGTNDWETVTNAPVTFTGTAGGVWSRPSIDLSGYEGKRVRLGFLLHTEDRRSWDDSGAGWYLDDLVMLTGSNELPSPESFDQALNNWSVDAGTWEIGALGDGRTVAATVLTGNYHEWVYSRLVSPQFVVPSAGQNPRLRFWQAYSFGEGDSGQVQIKTGTDDWRTLASYGGTGGGVWSYPSLDLQGYAEQPVQLAFLLHSQDIRSWDDAGDGWYIDDVAVVTGPQPLPELETFDQGLTNWSVDAGTWEVGALSDGRTVAATVLGGNYHEWVYSRLISPPFTLVPSSQQPRLRFWQAYSFGEGDSGQVQIKAGTNDWQTLATYTGTGGGVWSYPSLDLTDFGGQPVQLAFLLHSQDIRSWDDAGDGWTIDDVAVVTGPNVLPSPEGFDRGLTNWSVDAGTWEIGPVADGRTVAATVLRGNYHEWVYSRLISPPFTVLPAAQQPRLRFSQAYSFGEGDSGQVQIRAGTNGWQTLATYEGTGGGVWSYPSVDLIEYAGLTVQLAFLVHSQDIRSWDDAGDGWYIDDVVVVGGPTTFPNPETFDGGLSDWSVSAGTWEVGTLPDGRTIAATVLNGDYHEWVHSRLISPTFEVPMADANPSLSLWHWFSFGEGDFGSLQLRAGTNDWVTLRTYSGNSGGFRTNELPVELFPYAGQTVQLAFLFHSEDVRSWADAGDGWAIDAVMLVTDGCSIDPIPDATLDEETELRLAIRSNCTSFRLAGPVIEGAALDPVTGMFTWTPTEAQGPSTNVFTIRVGDERQPALVATRSFRVIVREVNRAPALTAVADRTVPVCTTVSFPLEATDQDIPRTTLRYQLEPGAPDGATLNPATGWFLWSPTTNELGTHVISVRVTDSAGLSAVNQFTLTVMTPDGLYFSRLEELAPRVLMMTICGGTNGGRYTIQATSTLARPGEWTDLITVYPEHHPFTYLDYVPETEPTRFYRVRTAD
jgi:hypothetical protein